MNTIRKIAIGLGVVALGLLGVASIGLTAGIVWVTRDIPPGAFACVVDSCLAAFK